MRLRSFCQGLRNCKRIWSLYAIGELRLSQGLDCLIDKTIPNNKIQRTGARIHDLPDYFFAAADLERYALITAELIIRPLRRTQAASNMKKRLSKDPHRLTNSSTREFDQSIPTQ
jgi:hypothetical protein